MSHVRCYTNCYGPFGVWCAVELIRLAGLSAIELALRPHNAGGLVIPEDAILTEKTPRAEVDRYQHHLEVHDVRVTSCNIGGGDMRTAEGRALTEQRMRCARQWFGVDLVVSNAGQPVSDAERAAVVDNLRWLGDTAADLGMTLSLETHKGPTQNAAAMLALMDDVRHDHIGINFDSGNIAYYNPGADPVRELELAVPVVRSVHLKDNRGGFEDWHFPALGDGCGVDFARLRQLLDESNYSGDFTIEIEGIGDEPEPGLEERHNRVRRSVEHLRACGYAID